MKTSASETDLPLLRIMLFGPMQVLVEGRPLPHLPSRKALWLLALLALRHGRPVEREWLAGALWPDAEQDQALSSLRPALSHLRRALGSQAGRLQSPSRHSLRLDLTDASVDVLKFDAAISHGGPDALAQAAALYLGPLLEGCGEEWVSQERDPREEDCLRALAALAEAARAAGDYDAAVGYTRRAVTLAPWRDGARRGLMEALAQGGDTSAALQVYREFTQMLRGEAMAAPDKETSALYSRLRSEARQRAEVRQPTGVSHASPVLIAAPTVTGYLPHPLTDLVGREDERLEVAARLRSARLVTLTGPGGIGKTRLAIEAAAEAAFEYPDGVWLVALEALTKNAEVARQIASMLGLGGEPGRPLLEILTGHLRAKRLLLVLDNCEHLLEATAQVTGHLLRECAALRILATSREKLGLMGEAAWAVPALAIPDPAHLPKGRAARQTLMSYESVQLFVERAQAVHKAFAVTEDVALAVAGICARLEGIPLAIELAAARVKALTVSQITERLGDYLGLLTGGGRTALPRQQTLRATLDWSYDLLSRPEQTLLECLSVFSGGWDLDAAEAVCAEAGPMAVHVLDLLESLVDKSLVVFQEHEFGGRYRLLDTLRQYAAERMGAAETTQARTRHRDHFLALAEQAGPQLTGAEQETWLARLDAEHANLRLALDWCGAEKDGAEAGLRLAVALGRFWEMRGHHSEGRAYLSKALDQGMGSQRRDRRAKALSAAGVLAFYQGDHAAAAAAHEEALAIFQNLGDRAGAAWALNDLGDVASARGDDSAARPLFEESLTIFRDLSDRQGVASLLHHLGRLVRDTGDLSAARALYEEGLAIQREMGNRQGAAWALHHLGHLTVVQGDGVLGRSLQEEALAIFRGLGNRQGEAWALQELGQVMLAQSDAGRAQDLYQESLTLFRELGNRQGLALSLGYLADVLGTQGDQAAAQSMREEAHVVMRELAAGRDQREDALSEQ